ncbi:MAG: ATPase [Bacteroidetes bacterium]|nr:ATPase [Bacteroidota bacterium]
MAKKKFTLEYIIRSSPSILFEFLTQPTNLSQWFSDYCDSQEDIFIFGWGGSDFQRARQVDVMDEESVRYHWEHGNKDEYFAFKVYKSEIANDTILEITDFADAKEVKEQPFLWDKQVEDLKHALGA